MNSFNWIPVSDKPLPKEQVNFYVVLKSSSWYRRVMEVSFVPAHTLDLSGYDFKEELADFSEEDNCYYAREGYYEEGFRNKESCTSLPVEKVTHWLPSSIILPAEE